MNKAEDGTEFGPGSLMFNYYDMKPVIVGEAKSGSFEGWFEVKQYDRDEPDHWVGNTLLNGSRMCSLQSAVRYGFLTDEQLRKVHLHHDETDGIHAR